VKRFRRAGDQRKRARRRQRAGSGRLVGIRIPAPGHGTDRWLTTAVVSDNRISGAVQVKIQRHGPTVPFLAISGNPAGRAVLEGDGNPNEIPVIAPPAVFSFRSTRQPARLYLKASGTGGTGWVENGNRDLKGAPVWRILRRQRLAVCVPELVQSI